MDLTGSPLLTREAWSTPQAVDLYNIWRELCRAWFTLTRPVASLSLSQGTSFSISTIFTVKQAGLYRFNYYLVTAVTGGAGTCLVRVDWSDGISSQNVSSSTINLTVLGSLQQGQVVMECAGGTIVTVLTTVAGASGNPVYQLFVALEAVPML
jgi:hypothetical protein